MERVLQFEYPFERKAEAEKLKTVLKENNVVFICYEASKYYSHKFIVRKSGKKWNDLYKLINSVQATKYSFKNTDIEIRNGKWAEICYCN
mgnify:CR=1 FL=1